MPMVFQGHTAPKRRLPRLHEEKQNRINQKWTTYVSCRYALAQGLGTLEGDFGGNSTLHSQYYTYMPST